MHFRQDGVLYQKVATAKKSDFNPDTVLSTNGKGRAMLSFGKKSTIFAQGDETMDCFSSKKERCNSALYRKLGRKQLWAS